MNACDKLTDINTDRQSDRHAAIQPLSQQDKQTYRET